MNLWSVDCSAFDLSSVYIQFYAAYWGTESADNAYVDNVNVMPITTSGLQAWWAADDLVLANNAAVASWPAHANYGPTLAEATSRPAFTTGLAGNKPAVRFTRSSGHILSSPPGPYLRNTTGATVFVFGRTNIGVGHRTFFVVEKNTANFDRLSLDSKANTGELEINGRRLDSDSFTTFQTSEVAPSTAPKSMRVVVDYSAATANVYLDHVS